MQQNNSDPYLSHIQKSTQNVITDLKVTAKAIKLLEITKGENLCDFGLVKEVSDKSPGP